MLDKLKKFFTKEPPKQKTPRIKPQPKTSPKDLATEKGEPWVEIVSMALDPNDPSNGAFELDWNDKFVANLVRAGYPGKTDVDIVDNWFKSVCRNVLIEGWEQEQADPANRSSNRKDIGGGRSEIS